MKKGLLLICAIATASLTGCRPNVDYYVGIAQYGTFDALDNATKGFEEKLTTLMTEAGHTVAFKETNAQGQMDKTSVIVNNLISRKVDLIMANATPCLTAAYNATKEIPIIGTSVSHYPSALEIEITDGKTGTNISGTSDLAPLNKQVEIMLELLPNATKFGLLYSPNEANSKYQVDEVETLLVAAGKQVKKYGIAKQDLINSVCNTAKSESDAIFIPTDNFCAGNATTICGIFEGSNVPVFAGESGICKGCGFATLSIDYYTLGEITAEMAFNVLTGNKDIKEYAIQYDNNPQKYYVASRCQALGITIPQNAGYQELAID